MPDLRATFLWIARLEGASLLLLLFVAMPLKYGAGWEHATQVPGWAHGALFVAYVVLLLIVGIRERWEVVTLGLGLAASFVPFGTFAFERRVLTGA